jgi:hypothetical protein
MVPEPWKELVQLCLHPQGLVRHEWYARQGSYWRQSQDSLFVSPKPYPMPPMTNPHTRQAELVHKLVGPERLRQRQAGIPRLDQQGPARQDLLRVD